MKYASFFANWVLGVLFFIVSLLAIINSSFVSGLLLLIASLTLMPISRRFVLPKINEKMSPMIRAAFVSILFIGFVVSVQPNEAQLLAQKEIKLAEEAALLEQQQIAKAAGFLSVEEYEEAKSVEMPTKALYDAYLSQQAELKLNEEKRKAEQKRLIAEAEEKRKVEEAEKAKLAAKAEEKRKAEEAEKAILAAIETVLICQSPKHSTDYTVIALFSETANVIPFSSGGLFDEALKFGAPMSKSTSSIEIRIYYWDKGFNINRQNLKLSKARTFRAGGEPFVMGYVDNCRVGSTTDYQKARNVVRKKMDADKKRREKAKQDAIKKQKI